MHAILIPWCAGASRHERLVRRHVPDSDPGSIPAPAGDTNHRRPNNDSPGSQERNVGLGLVPRQGAGWGAQTTPEPFDRSMHAILIPWCAGDSRHERLVRRHVPDSDPGWIPAPAGDTNHRRPNNRQPRVAREKCRAGACPQPGVGWGAQTTPEPFDRSMHPIFIPWCVGDSRHGRLVREYVAPVKSYLYKATSGLLRPVDPIFYHLLPMCPVCTGDLPLPLGEGWGEGQSGNRGSRQQ